MSLFDQRVEQRGNLERVTARVGALIVSFVAVALVGQQNFTADQLRRFVLFHEPATAPASPDRILRQLRQQGRLNYRVVNRRQSLYEALPVIGERV